MSKITDQAYLRLPADAKAFADGFLAVAKPYTATEVARVLTDFQHGINYMGCGKAHCAAAYAEAKNGKRAGLQISENRLASLTMNQLRELLAAERKRLEDGRQRKLDTEARWKREREERLTHQQARTLAADRWQALEKHNLLQALWDSGRPVNLTELTALIDETLAAQARG